MNVEGALATVKALEDAEMSVILKTPKQNKTGRRRSGITPSRLFMSGGASRVLVAPPDVSEEKEPQVLFSEESETTKPQLTEEESFDGGEKESGEVQVDEWDIEEKEDKEEEACKQEVAVSQPQQQHKTPIKSTKFCCCCR